MCENVLMRYFDDFIDYKDDKKTILIIGKFDGVHLGHMKLIEAALKTKAAERVVLMTFEREHDLILDKKDKLDLLEKCGVDIVVNVSAKSTLYGYTHERFVKEVACGRFHASTIICGENFCFGRNRLGDTSYLAEASGIYGYRLIVVPMESYDGDYISSMRIRGVLADGDIQDANAMLGRNFYITGKVCAGNKIGRQYGFPTANVIYPDTICKVRRGVYASYVWIHDKKYNALTNIGVKPTVACEDNLLSESFIYDFSDDIYGEDIRIELLRFFRAERRFVNLDGLFEQIEKDKIAVSDYLGGSI